MEEWLIQYGAKAVYLITLLGSFVEGESVILTASALAYKYEQISLINLMMIAFAGSLAADQILFFVGRHYGPRIIETRPSLKKASSRVFYHLHRHSTLFILSFRFIYGIRTASPIIIGAAGVSIKRYAILNVIAAFIWSILSCSVGYMIGYFFADDIEAFITTLGQNMKYTAIGAISLAVAIGVCVYLYRRYKQQKPDA